ncbi:glycosyltransferase family 4 protein [Pseudodesulfovibrio portus]|uniref:Uncharacterized protein n=1 Tax=Pseudodesulfovibrio portus TaxID=231439 RepID=A0ABN6RXS6_9BACT|nr:glycosyltransferase family 4 protein [Pseudodesulfovibrio portus]BDQ34696.1 hypothetical protein JCM14722_22380 [Pseudodesulfovibrio portus]
MTRRPLTILSVGHADSPQYRERTARFVGLGHDVVELTGSKSVVSGARAIIPRGVPAGRCWRLIGLSRIIHCLKTVRGLSPDLVFVHYAKGLWGWTAPLFGAPVAVSVMGGDVLFDEQGTANAWNRAATKGLLENAALVLCKSDYLAQRVRALPVAGQVETHAWGIDTDVFSIGSGEEFRREHAIPDDSPVVFSPRAMEPLYNTRLVVRAFAASGMAGEGARLVLSTYKADAAYRAEVERDCLDAGLGDSVIFLPPQDDRGMAGAFRAADVVVSVPSSDGLPQTFFESTACGAPLVMADLPNYGHYFSHGRDVWLTPAESSAVARGIGAVCRDAELRRSLVRGARETMTRLSLGGGDQVLDQRLGQAAQGETASLGAKVRQSVRVLGALVTGEATARTGQPVCRTFGEYFRSLHAKAGW